MAHDELVAKIDDSFAEIPVDYGQADAHKALRAVVELHKPECNWGADVCEHCFRIAWEITGLYMDDADFTYPCPTIQAIEKELV